MSLEFQKNFSEKLKKNPVIKNPLICVLINGFDKSDEDIKITISSVAQNTLTSISVIVMTKSNKLNSFINNDQRITIINNKKNINKILSIIEKTPFFTILDAGEYIAEQYLETSYITLSLNDNSTMTYTDTINYKDEKAYNYMFDYKILRNKYLPVPNLVYKNTLRDRVLSNELEDIKTFEFFTKIIEGENVIHQSYYGFYTNKTTSDLTTTKYPIFEERLFKSNVSNYPKEEYYWEIIKSNKEKLRIDKHKSNKKNILLLIPWMIVGGADKFNLDFLRLINKDKYSISIVTDIPKEYVWRQKFEKYTKDIFDISSFINRSDWPTFLEYLIDTRDIDLVIISNTTFGYNIIPYLKLKYPKIPIIDYIHMPELYNRGGGFARDNMAQNVLIDKTLTCCKDASNMLINHFSIPNNKVDTVYIGVDSDKFINTKEKRENALKKYNIVDKTTIGYICRIGYQKRPLLLAEIIRESVKDNPNYLFIIGGEGPLLNSFKRKIKQYGLDDNVLLLGNVEDTIEFYSMCDITINCSIKEGLALTAYESLSMGVPVLSADVGGHKELIDDKVGLIVPLLQNETDIEKFEYSDEEIDLYVKGLKYISHNLEDFKKNCRARVLKKFSLNKMIQNMEKEIDTIIDNPNLEVRKTANNLKMYENIILENYNHYLMGTQYEYQTNINRYYSYFDKKIPKIEDTSKKHSEEYYLTRKTAKNFIDLLLYPFRIIIMGMRRIKRLLERRKNDG